MRILVATTVEGCTHAGEVHAADLVDDDKKVLLGVCLYREAGTGRSSPKQPFAGSSLRNLAHVPRRRKRADQSTDPDRKTRSICAWSTP